MKLKRFSILRQKKLLATPPKPDMPEMPDYPLNIYVMALCNMCLKHMKKLGASESVGIHLSTIEGTSGVIYFSADHECYSLRAGKWTKIKEV